MTRKMLRLRDFGLPRLAPYRIELLHGDVDNRAIDRMVIDIKSIMANVLGLIKWQSSKPPK